MLGFLGDLLNRKRKPSFHVRPAGDASMSEAVENARFLQSVFWTHFEAQTPERVGFRVKVGLTTPAGATEHVWMAVGRREGDQISGVLLSQPVDLEDINEADDLTVDAERLSDWSYAKDGLLYGGFTMRVSLDRMPKWERGRALKVLAANPIELDAE